MENVGTLYTALLDHAPNRFGAFLGRGGLLATKTHTQSSGSLVLRLSGLVKMPQDNCLSKVDNCN